MTHELPPEPLTPEDYLLENNPSLQEIAQTDLNLQDRLRALRMARLFAQSSPDIASIQALPMNMEETVREYVERVGYAWEELQRPEDTES